LHFPKILCVFALLIVEQKSKTMKRFTALVLFALLWVYAPPAKADEVPKEPQSDCALVDIVSEQPAPIAPVVSTDFVPIANEVCSLPQANKNEKKIILKKEAVSVFVATNPRQRVVGARFYSATSAKLRTNKKALPKTGLFFVGDALHFAKVVCMELCPNIAETVGKGICQVFSA
jgi:hypothetical protein